MLCKRYSLSSNPHNPTKGRSSSTHIFNPSTPPRKYGGWRQESYGPAIPAYASVSHRHLSPTWWKVGTNTRHCSLITTCALLCTHTHAHRDSLTHSLIHTHTDTHRTYAASVLFCFQCSHSGQDTPRQERSPSTGA